MRRNRKFSPSVDGRECCLEVRLALDGAPPAPVGVTAPVTPAPADLQPAWNLVPGIMGDQTGTIGAYPQVAAPVTVAQPYSAAYVPGIDTYYGIWWA